MHGCLSSAVSETRLKALLLPGPRIKYSLGPDKINSSLGRISSLPVFYVFFFSVQLFVFKSGIDLWFGEGSYAKQCEVPTLTNIQKAIELSFIW